MVFYSWTNAARFYLVRVRLSADNAKSPEPSRSTTMAQESSGSDERFEVDDVRAVPAAVTVPPFTGGEHPAVPLAGRPQERPEGCQ